MMMLVFMLMAAALVMVMVMLVVMLVLMVMVMMVMFMLMLMLMLLVLMVMVVAGAVGIVALLAVMMMVMVLVLIGLMFGPHLLQQFIGQRDLFDGGEDGDNGGIGVFLPEHGHGGLQLLLRHLLSPGEDDSAGGLDLVVVELAEVLHIDLHLGGVCHGDEAVELHLGNVLYGVFHRHDHVAELAHAGGLNEDAVGVELSLHVLQSLVEIAHQRAADAPGGHFGDLDPLRSRRQC